MTEELEPSTKVTDDNANGDTLDAIDNALSVIPAPIKRSALKAFTQLCNAAIDVPVAHLEGLAAEKRAETKARIKLINKESVQIARQMEVPSEYADAAVSKFGQKIIREQVNLDKISETAAEELINSGENLSETANQKPQEKEIREDWLNVFEREASNKSSDEMQLLFGKILAGEIQRPSSYSIKTVKIISQLDNQAAKLFQTLCSLCVSLQGGNVVTDARVVSLNGNAATNSLSAFGLDFGALNILHEYGLIISDYNSYFNYNMCIADEKRMARFPFTFQGKIYGLAPSPEQEKRPTSIKLHGVALSKSGKELLNIIDVNPSKMYQASLRQHFESKHFQMVEIGQPVNT